MSFPSKRRAAAALVAAAAFAFSGLFATTAVAGDGVGDIPSVAVSPAHPDKHDPNGGQWFVLSLPPGGSGTVDAQISNPAKVTQTVTFALRDLTFADDGTPRIADAGPQKDVGAWGQPARPSIDLAANSTVIVPFKITVPADAEPGDHVGAIVGITANLQGKFRVVRQIGARFYVTVSGEATRSFSIASVTPTKNSTWWPSTIDTSVVLRNDGRVRVRPQVTVGGRQADGSRLLLSRSVEKYTASVSVPWYGGPVDLTVKAVTDDGTVRTVHKSIFVVPVGLIVVTIVGLLLLYGVYRLLRRRLRRVGSVRADIERLERLVAQKAAEPAVQVAVEPAASTEDDTADALLVALKRAQRNGSNPTTLSRLALSLHEAGGPAVPWLVEALKVADDDHRQELIDALRRSDRTTAEAELLRAGAPPEAVDELLGPAVPENSEVADVEPAPELEPEPPTVKAPQPARRKRTTTAAVDGPPRPRTSSEDAPKD